MNSVIVISDAESSSSWHSMALDAASNERASGYDENVTNAEIRSVEESVLVINADNCNAVKLQYKNSKDHEFETKSCFASCKQNHQQISYKFPWMIFTISLIQVNLFQLSTRCTLSAISQRPPIPRLQFTTCTATNHFVCYCFRPRRNPICGDFSLIIFCTLDRRIYF